MDEKIKVPLTIQKERENYKNKSSTKKTSFKFSITTRQ